MAYYSPLEDGSYLVEREDGLPPLRTAVDPVEYGYEQRSPEELAGYTPKPPTAEERLGAITARLEKSKRESDPEYAAEADAYDRQAVETQRLGESIKLARQAAPEQPTAQVSFGEADKLGGYGDSTRQVSDAGPSRVRLAPEQPAAPRATQQKQQEGDGARQALSELALQNVVKRSGPTKGGWSPTTVTTQREGTPTPEALAGVEQAARDVDTIGEQAINQRVSTLRERVIAPELERLEAEVEDIEKKAERRKKYDSEIARLKTNAEGKERAAQEMPRINARDDYWADKGIFARILAAVAAGAFQFGQGLAGGSGPNIPIELTEAAIAENAELLRQQHDDATAAGVTARNAYTEALDTYGDPESAQTALRLETQAVADRMMDLRLRDVAGADQLAQWEVQKAERREQRAREYADISAKAAGTTVANERYTPASSGGTSVDPKWIDTWLKLNPNASKEESVSALRAATESRVRLPPQLAKATGQDFGFAKDATQAKDAEVALQRGESGLDAINRIKTILGPSGRPIVPEDRAAAQAAMTEIQTHLASPFYLQQQTGEELELTKKLTGAQAIDLFTTGTVGQGIKALEAAERAFKRTVNAYQRTLTKSYGAEDVIVPNYESKK
jgi:hypothetical protein